MPTIWAEELWGDISIPHGSIPITGDNRYQFTLTGEPDDVEDVVIPVSSISFRRINNGEITMTSSTEGEVDPLWPPGVETTHRFVGEFLTVTIPYTAAYAGQIADRPNGEMVISFESTDESGLPVTEEGVRVDIEKFSTSLGPVDKYISVSGSRVSVYDTSKTVELSYRVYQSVDDGSYTFKFPKVNFLIWPWDTVEVDGYSITAFNITSNISASSGGDISQSMEVAEA